MAGEDTVNAVVDMGLKVPDVLMKLLEIARFLSGTYGKMVNGGNSITENLSKSINNLTADGRVINAAKSANAQYKQISVPKQDMKQINAMCKTNNIPVAFFQNKNSPNVTLAYSSNYQNTLENVLRDTLKARLEIKPGDFSVFSLKPGEAVSIKALCEKNGIDAHFTKSGNNVNCIFQNKDKSAIDILKNDYKAMRAELNKNFSCGFDKERGKFFVSDKQADRTLWLNSFKTESKIEDALKERLGYDIVKAQAAARVFGTKLTEQQLQAYQLNTRQADILNGLSRDLKLPDESLLLRDVQFNCVNFKADGKDRFLIVNGDKAVSLVPAEMNREQMETAVRDKLGISDTEKIKQICDKTELLGEQQKYLVANEKGSYKIEKMSGREFAVEFDGRTVHFDLTERRKNSTIEALQKRFGMSESKAQEIWNKAKSQNALANAFKKAQSERAAKSVSHKSAVPRIKPPKKGVKI